MQGIYLKFFVHENDKLHGKLAYEWLLEQAKKMDIQGGSALRAIAGYGRHGKLHEDHFFELAGDLPIVVEFIVSEEQAQRLLDLVAGENAALFYLKLPAEFGRTATKKQ